jgi:hypothetical protein
VPPQLPGPGPGRQVHRHVRGGVHRRPACGSSRLPCGRPRANTIAERRAGSARRACLDRMLVTSGRHLPPVLTEYIDHHNPHRPHRTQRRFALTGRTEVTDRMLIFGHRHLRTILAPIPGPLQSTPSPPQPPALLAPARPPSRRPAANPASPPSRRHHQPTRASRPAQARTGGRVLKPHTPPLTSPSSGSSAGLSSAASSTNISEPGKSPGQNQRPSSETPQPVQWRKVLSMINEYCRAA